MAWIFHKLQRLRAAELANNQMLTQIQESRAEQQEVKNRLRQQPQLAIQININEAAFPTKGCFSLLCVMVIQKNEGDQNLRVDLATSALTTARAICRAVRCLHRISELSKSFGCHDKRNLIPNLQELCSKLAFSGHPDLKKFVHTYYANAPPVHLTRRSRGDEGILVSAAIRGQVVLLQRRGTPNVTTSLCGSKMKLESKELMPEYLAESDR